MKSRHIYSSLLALFCILFAAGGLSAQRRSHKLPRVKVIPATVEKRYRAEKFEVESKKPTSNLNSASTIEFRQISLDTVVSEIPKEDLVIIVKESVESTTENGSENVKPIISKNDFAETFLKHYSGRVKEGSYATDEITGTNVNIWVLVYILAYILAAVFGIIALIIVLTSVNFTLFLVFIILAAIFALAASVILMLLQFGII